MRAYQTIYLSLLPDLAWLFLRNWISPMAIFSVNPRLAWGGSGFDAKYERYRILAASPIAIPTVLIDARTTFDQAAFRGLMEAHRIALPLIAKPNRGHLSHGVRKLTAMAEVLGLFGRERKSDYLLQPFIDYPHEFSVFYGRIPGEQGRILDLTERVLPHVEGDGLSSVAELIARRRWPPEVRRAIEAAYQGRLDECPRPGDSLSLVVAGGRPEGAQFVHRPELVTQALEHLLDVVATRADFHFGKFDIKVRNPEALAEGREVKLLEVNGCTAQLTSIFDEKFTFWSARRAVARQARFLVAVCKGTKAHAPRPTLRQLRREWGEWREVSRQ